MIDVCGCGGVRDEIGRCMGGGTGCHTILNSYKMYNELHANRESFLSYTCIEFQHAVKEPKLY